MFPAVAVLILLSLLLVMGCGEEEKQTEPASLPTRGKLVIGIDESLKPFADAEIAMFSVDYPDAHITPLYLPEKEVIEKLLTNSIQTGLLCRDLFPEETELLSGNYAHSAGSFKLADDKIVAVANRANPIDALSCDQLKEILSGKISDWEALKEETPLNSHSTPITVVLTSASSIDRFFSSADSLSSGSAYALETTTEVIDYVRDNAAAIGILGGSWFFQKGSGYSDVKVLACSDENQRLTREVYAVTHEPVTGLGSGFISFMAGRKGQLILSKAGMTPYKSIERQIELLDSFQE